MENASDSDLGSNSGGSEGEENCGITNSEEQERCKNQLIYQVLKY